MSKMQLFNENDNDIEEDTLNFEVKKQFEGNKGQKLLALQSKYKNDKRFTIDSRFYEEENEEYDFQQPVPQDILRFDPLKPEHAQYEIRDSGPTKATPNRKQSKLPEHPVEVSKEVFYKVSENLKDALKEKASFSLLNMFGTAEANEEDNNEKEEDYYENVPKPDKDLNPFRYDSSDTEEEVTFSKKEVGKRKERKKNENDIIKWKETFFFKENDNRFREGLEFLKKRTREQPVSFEERSREFRNVLRSKIKHIQQQQKPFRNKLQSHKMIKLKKALKNK